MNKIKIGIIGTSIGARTHPKGFHLFPDDAIKESADKDADIDFNEETNSYCYNNPKGKVQNETNSRQH